MIKIIKRDGVKVPFEPLKIVNAIMKSMEAVGSSNQSLAEGISSRIVFEVEGSDRDEYSVSEIHSLVEMHLSNYCAEVGEVYKGFRVQRDKAREVDSRFIKEITSLVSGDNIVRNENANKDAKVFPVQRDLIAGIVSKHMGRNYVLPTHIVEAHDSGDIHYHDLDYAPFLPMTNCCLVDLKGLLENGFKLGNAQIESPKSIGVACAVMAQITAQVASHQYGGTTFANIDQVLEPYVQASWTKHWNIGMEEGVSDVGGYADRRTEKEVLDGVQGYELK